MAVNRNPKVITVTLNPSLDRTIVTHYLAIGHQNSTTGSTRLDAAGEGINISRALQQLGVETHAIVLLGDDASGSAYQALLPSNEYGISIVRANGATRSNMIVVDTGNHTETQIIEESHEVEREDIVKVSNIVKEITKPGDMVVITGYSAGKDFFDIYPMLINIARKAQAHVMVIAVGSVLNEAVKAGPDIIAMNQNEAEVFFNYPVRENDSALSCAESIREQGVVEQILIENREKGSLLLSTAVDDSWIVELPDVRLGTTSGVWEALLAGFLAGFIWDKPVEETLKMSGAAAVYTTSHIGHAYGTMEDVERFMEKVDVLVTQNPTL